MRFTLVTLFGVTLTCSLVLGAFRRAAHLWGPLTGLAFVFMTSACLVVCWTAYLTKQWDHYALALIAIAVMICVWCVALT